MPREWLLAPHTVDEADGSSRVDLDVSVVETWGGIFYSSTSASLCRVDADQAVLDSLAGRGGTDRLCTDGELGQAIGAVRLATLAVTLATHGIPAMRFAATDPWRDILSRICNMCLFSQRLQGRTGRGWLERLGDLSITAELTWTLCPVSLRADIAGAAESIGWSTFAPRLTQTLGSVLRDAAEEFPGVVLKFGRDAQGNVVTLDAAR